MIRVAFFKASHGELDDKVIDFGSGNIGYSHCEYMTSEYSTIGAHYKDNIVEERYYNNLLSDPRWVVLEINYDEVIPEKNMVAAIGTKYDTAGVVCKFIGLNACINDEKTWCSKVIAESLNHVNINIMPNELFTYLKEVGGSIISNVASNEVIPKVDKTNKLGRITREEFLELMKNKGLKK